MSTYNHLTEYSLYTYVCVSAAESEETFNPVYFLPLYVIWGTPKRNKWRTCVMTCTLWRICFPRLWQPTSRAVAVWRVQSVGIRVLIRVFLLTAHPLPTTPFTGVDTWSARCVLVTLGSRLHCVVDILSAACKWYVMLSYSTSTRARACMRVCAYVCEGEREKGREIPKFTKEKCLLK